MSLVYAWLCLSIFMGLCSSATRNAPLDSRENVDILGGGEMSLFLKVKPGLSINHSTHVDAIATPSPLNEGVVRL